MVPNDELRARLLSEIEKMGDIDPTVLLNTVLETKKGEPWERTSVMAVLNQLIEEDLVRMAAFATTTTPVIDQSKDEAFLMLAAIDEVLYFDAKVQSWQDTRPQDRSRPDAVVTESGSKVGREILEDRGYRWWFEKP